MLKLGISTSTNSHEILKSNFEIVLNPEVKSYGEKTEFNFDAFLLIDGDCTDFIENHIKVMCDNSNIPFMGVRRFSKITQSTILYNYNIYHPLTYFISGDRSREINGFSLVNILSKLNDNDLIVVKMTNGARGIGQFKCTKKDLIQLYNTDINFYDLKETKKYDISESIDNYKINSKQKIEITKIIERIQTGNEGWSSHITGLLQDGRGFLIQKFEKVKQEFRLLYFFQEEPIIIERQCGIDGTWQANSCITGSGNQLSLKESKIPNSLLQSINNMCIDLKIPFLSLDLYETENNSWGVFEFQPEFGILHVPYNDLEVKLNASVINMLNFLKK